MTVPRLWLLSVSSYTNMPDESISLEETNKIRISLGLKPLGGDKTDQTTKTVSKEEEAENNYAKKLEEEAKDREIKCV